MLTGKEFPSLSKEDYTESGEPKYGGSIGLNRFYDNLVKHASKVGAPDFRVIVLNALTLIRNNYDKPYKELQKRCQADINTMITYLTIYLKKTKDIDRKVSIIVLYPDYVRLPLSLRKPANTQLSRILDHYSKDVKFVRDGLDKYYDNDIVQVFTLKAGDRSRYPHMVLKDLLMGEIDNEKRNKVVIPYRLREPIHLISHISLDWHLSELLRSVYLLESYTGEIITSDYFGSKLVKKKDIRVPFNSVIHQTFGDDTLIKALAVRKPKKILLDTIDRWSMMTQTKITESIAKTLDIPVSTLTKDKFI